MSIYFFELPKTGKKISGGENCLVQNVKYLQNKHKCIIITTELGKEVFTARIGYSQNVKYITVATSDRETQIGIFFSYILRTVKAVKKISKINLKNSDIMICNSDFFPNSIPFFLLASSNKRVKLIYWWRVLAPDILKGFAGQYTNKHYLPRFNIVHYKLNQFLYKALTKKRGIILTPARYYHNHLMKMFPNNVVKVLYPYGGSSIKKNILDNKIKNKDIDIIWIGRFQELKGLEDFIKAIKSLKKTYYGVCVAVLGGGTVDVVKEFKKQIKVNNLSKNIKYYGFVEGEKKNNLLQRSKIFAMTSYYESYGQVILEAMSHGLPVVAYELPTFDVFSEGIIKVSIRNHEQFAIALKDILCSENIYNNLTTDAISFSKRFSWHKTNIAFEKIIYDK